MQHSKVVYRPPDAEENSFKNIIKFIINTLEDNTDDSYQICLSGDLNFPSINWELSTVIGGCPAYIRRSAEDFLALLSSTMMNQFVHTPTRRENILDIFCTNNPFLVNYVEVSSTPISDHNLILISLSIDLEDIGHKECMPPPSGFSALDFSKANFDSISHEIEAKDWDMIRQDCSFEQFPEKMTKELLTICQSNVPTRKPKTGKPRLQNALRRKKKRLEKRLANTTKKSVETKLERELAFVHYEIKEAYNERKNMEETAAVNRLKSNPKSFYSYAKSHSHMKSDIIMMKNSNGIMTRDPRAISDILQSQFSSVYSNPNCEDKKDPDFPPLAEDLLLPEHFQITESDIISAARDLKKNSSPGPDGVPAELIIKCSSSLVIPFAIIWRESFTLAKVPQYYKESYVCPIHKKGDRTIAANHRPISLTSHVMKTAERIVRRIIVDHLETNEVISKDQHGFRSGRSTLTQLLMHFDSVFDAMLQGNDIDTIYLDYAKAFDKVDHQLLLLKMARYGFPENLIQWISSFLSGRCQTVVVKGAHSQEAAVISGVPQGTVLGPVLFLLFINDLDNKIFNSKICFFADDTRISKQIETMGSKFLLEQDLSNVLDWSKANNMELNKQKFELQSYKLKQSPLLSELPFQSELFSYRVSEEVILEPISSVKDLGVIVSSDLSWSSHIATIVTRGVACSCMGLECL